MRLKPREIRDMIFDEKVSSLMGTEKQAGLKREETLKAIEQLFLLDDNLMVLAFDRNIEATELLLQCYPPAQ